MPCVLLLELNWLNSLLELVGLDCSLLEDCCEEELSNDLIRHVISDMKKLAQGLEDKFLCTALCVSADAILEQIALLDQKVSIF